MFCPSCKDEFRPGFTRCGRCNVDLVEDLSSEKSPTGTVEPGPPLPVKLVEFCGFFSLDEARGARDRLREQQIRSEIVIREAPDTDFERAVEEEFWIRVEASRIREVASLVGDVPEVEAEPEQDEGGFACGQCGQNVADDEVFCPKCGARFEE